MKPRLIFLEWLLGGPDAEESQQKKRANEEAAGGHAQKDVGDREP